MFSRPLAFLLLALGCVTAAAGGAYVATRQNDASQTTTVAGTATPAVPSSVTAPGASQPVAETEAAVSAPKAAERPEPTPEAEPPARRREKATPKQRSTAPTRSARAAAPVVPTNGDTLPEPRQVPPQPAPAAPPPAAPVVEVPRQIEAAPEAPRVPQYEELILPASSVIGLQLESTLSSERARVEDRVDARVTRDVLAAGRVAIPAGSRVLGSVTFVERGGKVRERARLGVRFHTLILADGNEVPLQTEAIYRDGDSPAADSAKKIGVAAVGGAILGGILGGKKGAAIGAATGAGGGTAAVMAGDRHVASLRGGEIVTARLSSPATITVERRE